MSGDYAVALELLRMKLVKRAGDGRRRRQLPGSGCDALTPECVRGRLVGFGSGSTVPNRERAFRASSGPMQRSKDGARDPVTPALARISCEPDSFRRVTRHYTARGQEA